MKPASEVFANAPGRIGEKTLRNAAREIGVRFEKDGYQGRSFSRLPRAEEADTPKHGKDGNRGCTGIAATFVKEPSAGPASWGGGGMTRLPWHHPARAVLASLRYAGMGWRLDAGWLFVTGHTGGLLRLDARALKRTGCLRPGSVHAWGWTRGRDAEPAGDILLWMDAAGHCLTLDYRTRRPGDREWTPRQQPVWLEWTPCHYGGRRVWFACPGCHRRRAVLFSSGGVEVSRPGIPVDARGCHRTGEPAHYDAAPQAEGTRRMRPVPYPEPVAVDALADMRAAGIRAGDRASAARCAVLGGLDSLLSRSERLLTEQDG